MRGSAGTLCVLRQRLFPCRFHHIKSLTKRKHIVQWADELRLGGFSKPGFPGVFLCDAFGCPIQTNAEASLTKHRPLLCCTTEQRPPDAGVIVVEGLADDMEEYVQRLRALKWQVRQAYGCIRRTFRYVHPPTRPHPKCTSNLKSHTASIVP